VKVQGEISWNAASSARTRTFKVDAVLKGARVGGKRMGTEDAPDAGVREAAERAFDAFRTGLGTGQWQAWFDCLTDDVTFVFPQGKWAGRHRGKAKAVEFFAYVSSVFREGLRVVAVECVSQQGETVVFEFCDEGTLSVPGQAPRPYRNRVAISLDMRGTQVAGYREYFGGDGTWY
jgi:ketosteroid isomerase-like protein